MITFTRRSQKIHNPERPLSVPTLTKPPPTGHSAGAAHWRAQEERPHTHREDQLRGHSEAELQSAQMCSTPNSVTRVTTWVESDRTDSCGLESRSVNYTHRQIMYTWASSQGRVLKIF